MINDYGTILPDSVIVGEPGAGGGGAIVGELYIRQLMWDGSEWHEIIEPDHQTVYWYLAAEDA